MHYTRRWQPHGNGTGGSPRLAPLDYLDNLCRQNGGASGPGFSASPSWNLVPSPLRSSILVLDTGRHLRMMA